MVNFNYIARKTDGAEVSGVIQADSEAAVARSLDERQLYPVHVSRQAAGRSSLGGRIRMRDTAVMYGQMADLLRVGVPVLQSLETLCRAAAKQRFAQVLRVVHDNVAEGKTLADALALHPTVFPPLHSAMIRAGEQGGFLEDVLANLSGFLERQDDLRSQVRNAMIYPILLICLGAVVVTAVLALMVPKFKVFFGKMSLPAPTMVLFAMSDALIYHWGILLFLLAAVVFGVWMFLRSGFGRRHWDRWRQKIPVYGRAARMVAITRFCRILGTLLANGVQILQALDISKDATGSPMLAESITQAGESVRAGAPLAGPLAQSGMFPPEVLEMITVAEESNQLEKVLLQIAETVERRTNQQVDAAVRLIEPLILVMIAAGVGFVAVGLMYPIFTLSQTLR